MEGLRRDVRRLAEIIRVKMQTITPALYALDSSSLGAKVYGLAVKGSTLSKDGERGKSTGR